MDEYNLPVLAQVEYDITSEEEKISFKEYQKIYTTKKKVFQSSLFLIIAIISLIRVIMQPDYTLLWGVMGIGIAFAAFIWINPIIIRKNLIKALKNIEGDKYQFSLYNEYFSIKTIQFVNNTVTPDTENNEENIEVSDIEPKVVKFEEEEFKFIEKMMYMLFFLKIKLIIQFQKDVWICKHKKLSAVSLRI